jgi:hypothetical protein
MSVGQELLDVPFGGMIKSMGLAIAQSQVELDTVSIRLAQMMAGQKIDVPNPAFDPRQPEGAANPRTTQVETRVTFGGQQLSLLELGFTPTFYQFVDTIIEVKVSIAIRSSFEASSSQTTVDANFDGVFLGFYNKGSMHGTTVSAAYASKYSYSAEGSSLIRTKLVPVPPPAVLQERIRRLVATPPTA